MSDETTTSQHPDEPAETRQREERAESAQPGGPTTGAGPEEPVTDAGPAEPAEGKPGSTPSAAWDQVVVALGGLGDALATWARSAADSPENRKHIDDIRNGVNDMAKQAGDAFHEMAGTEFGRQMGDSASQVGQAIGDTAAEFGQAAAPHIATALAGMAEAFGRAAQRVGEAATPGGEPPSREAPEPPRPAPSGDGADTASAPDDPLDPDEAE